VERFYAVVEGEMNIISCRPLSESAVGKRSTSFIILRRAGMRRIGGRYPTHGDGSTLIRRTEAKRVS
jgi:hypothetical protein